MQLQPCYIEKIIPVHEEVPFEVVEIKLHTLDEILTDVCNALNEPIEIVSGRSRKTEYILTRAIYMYVARIKTGKPLKQIADLVGRRDHTTCLHNIAAVKDHLYTKDPLFSEYWNRYLQNSLLFTKYDF